jgi:hypothetical protein
MMVCPWLLGFPGDTIGSTLASKTGFSHGSRQNALTEEIRRSPKAKRETVIYNNNKEGVTKRENARANMNGDVLAKHEGSL